ncbi:hypothetical protein [Halocatena halophila]|uniref:hypothetical protein n=1 Tax=Halocatena halophila TaxID=2814576 RepID=UPI002ED554D8
MTSDELEQLKEFLRSERDEYESLYQKACEESDRAGSNYAKGRYHSYCDVLAWILGELEDDND